MKNYLILSSFLLLTTSVYSQFKGPDYPDTYSSVIDTSKRQSWGPYNAHDPSVIKAGKFYYMYSTDAMVAYDPPAIKGIQVRKSPDLVNWEFVGFAFDGIPTEAIDHITANGKTTSGVWAPCITKRCNEYRLYWCVSSFGTKVSYLGLATSTSPEGPWTQKGCIVKTDETSTMNAIDPAIVQGEDGKQWLAYGSYFDGIYCKELDEKTGLAKDIDEKGTCIARRQPNAGNIEAAEFLFNPKEKKYYIFLSYDNLLDKYNVRVGRADKPNGPYYDINNVDLSTSVDNYPMILHPYKFYDHTGWQGTGHCGIISDDSGQFYMVHQGRPVQDKYMMVAHIRKIEWIKGWPVLSPQRYSGIPQKEYPDASLIPGKWEHMLLAYDASSFNLSTPLFTMELTDNGTIDKNPVNTWNYKAGMLYLSWNNGQFKDTAKVWAEWDWENKCICLVYSGFGNANVCIWGKSRHKLDITNTKNIFKDSRSTSLFRNDQINGQFIFNVTSPAKTDIDIYDIKGALIFKKRWLDLQSGNFNAKFKPGFYIIKVQSESKCEYKKINIVY